MFKILVSPRTQKEIENAIDYYILNSVIAPSKFIESISKAYLNISINPYKRLRYKNVRAIQLNHFPFALYFTVNNSLKIVFVISCFHNKRNPEKRP